MTCHVRNTCDERAGNASPSFLRFASELNVLDSNKVKKERFGIRERMRGSKRKNAGIAI